MNLKTAIHSKYKLFFIALFLSLLFSNLSFNNVLSANAQLTTKETATEVFNINTVQPRYLDVRTGIDNNSIVYLIDVTLGTEYVIVEESPTSLWLPFFKKFVTTSPDVKYGTYITADNLFMQNAKLWLVDLQSHDVQLLASFTNDFWTAPIVWSNNSDRIAFVKVGKSKNIELWMLDVKTGVQSLITSDNSFSAELFKISSPDIIRWSKDSKTIVFTDYVSQNGLQLEHLVDLETGNITENSFEMMVNADEEILALASLPCGVPQFSQNDPQWSSTIMQTCGYSIGSQGCALTSTSMVLKYYGVTTTPEQLNSCLGASACPLYWTTAASNCSSGKVSGGGLTGFSWSTLESELNNGRPVIVYMGCPSTTHAVVVVSGSGTSFSGYNINDPWDGSIKSFSSYSTCSLTGGTYGLHIYSGTPSCSGSCTAPSLNSPSDGYVSSSQQVSFSWSAITGCTFNGYTFRINDSPNMDDSPIVDQGEGSTSRTETIGSEWNYRDLWWGVRAANAPNGAAWATRRFRIEPGGNCPQDGGVILYWNANYNCSNGTGDPGYRQRTNTGLQNVNDGQFNDQASSVKVPSGWSVRLYNDADGFGGNGSICFNSSISDFGTQGNFSGTSTSINDHVSSMKVYDNTSCTDVIIPGPPTLSNPGNGSSNPYNYDLNFQWNSSSGATQYLVEWWGGPYSTMQPCGWSSSTSCHVGVIAAGNTYSWHVKARNSAGESNWSDTWTFTIQSNTVPDLVIQSITASPTSPSLNQPITFIVRVKNQGTGNATSSFYVDLFADAQPGSCPTDGNITYWTVSSLAAGATQDLTYTYNGFSISGTHNLYAIADSYCAVSESNDGNNTLGPVVLNVQQPQPPSAPTLSSPGNGSSNPYSYNLNFQWNASSGATEYLVEWWGGPYSTMQPCGWNSAMSCSIGTVAAGNTYSWHVKSRNSVGESPWSSTWTFTIQPQTFNLTISKNGTGSGTVTSSPSGISCGSDCSEAYANNTVVTLTATPASGSTFAGWSGDADCSDGQVTMNASKSCTATFNTTSNYTLSVNKAGTGSGTVASNPSGISCGSDCSESYTNGTSVTLTASPSTGSTFAGWSGACSGTGSCVVSMTAARSVTATFSINTYTLSVSKTGTGSGTVTSNPAGINCGPDCSEIYNYNTGVTLTATASTGSTFTGWSGACSGTGSCTMSMTAARSVTANFTLITTSVQAINASTADGNWNSKTSFAPGDPIQWVITVENMTGNDAQTDLSYVIKNPAGIVIANWQGVVTVQAGVWDWGLSGVIPTNGGTYTFLGAVTYQGVTTTRSTTYVVNAPIQTFADVPTTYWAWQFIERLYNAGITGGCSTSPLNYCPESEVTRAQMAVFLERGLHYPSAFTAPNVAPTFTDTVGHWAEDWIEALKSDGITSGCATGLYCPEAPVTRAQMAVFLLRAKYGSSYTPPAVGASAGFDDVPTDHWAAGWIKQLVAEGITSGCGGGNYCPDAPVTRAQMAVFLVRTFGLP